MKKLDTVDAVVADFLNRCPDLLQGLDKRLTQDEFATKFHISLGMKIRNDYGLWEDNQALLADCGVTQPDEASAVILKKLWQKLQTG